MKTPLEKLEEYFNTHEYEYGKIKQKFYYEGFPDVLFDSYSDITQLAYKNVTDKRLAYTKNMIEDLDKICPDGESGILIIKNEECDTVFLFYIQGEYLKYHKIDGKFRDSFQQEWISYSALPDNFKYEFINISHDDAAFKLNEVLNMDDSIYLQAKDIPETLQLIRTIISTVNKGKTQLDANAVTTLYSLITPEPDYDYSD